MEKRRSRRESNENIKNTENNELVKPSNERRKSKRKSTKGKKNRLSKLDKDINQNELIAEDIQEDIETYDNKNKNDNIVINSKTSKRK